MKNIIQHTALSYFSTSYAAINNNRKLNISTLNDLQKGMIIDTNGANSWDISFKPIIINELTNIGATYIAKDKSGRSKAIAQWAFLQSPEEPTAAMIVNGKLGGQYLQSMFSAHGNLLFDLSNKKSKPTQNEWLIAGTFNLSKEPLILSGMRLETKFIFNERGEAIDRQILKTFSVKGFADDCNKKMLHHPSYPIDQVRVVSSLKATLGISQNELDYSISKVIVTLEGVDDFSISDVQSNYNSFTAPFCYSHN